MLIKRNKFEEKLLISVFLIIYMLFLVYKSNYYFSIFYLFPIVFLFFILIIGVPNRKSPGYFVLYGVWLLRYIIQPFLMTFSLYDYSFHNSNIIFTVMVLEMFAQIFALRIIDRKINFKDKFNANKEMKFINNKVFIVSTLIMVSLFILQPEMFLKINFIFKFSLLEETDSGMFGIFYIYFAFYKIVFSTYLLSKISKWKLTTFIKIIISLVVVLVITSIDFTFNRSSYIFSLITYFYILTAFYGFKKMLKTIPFFIMIGILYYFTITNSVRDGIKENKDIIDYIHMIDMYFAGPRNIYYGLKTLNINLFNSRPQILYNDIINNVWFINRFFNTDVNNINIFNNVRYGHSLWADQIYPTITHGMFHFGLFGFFIPTIIIYLLVILTKKAESNKNYFMMYILCYASLRVAFFIPGNITIIVSGLTNILGLNFLFYKGIEFISHIKLNTYQQGIETIKEQIWVIFISFIITNKK